MYLTSFILTELIAPMEDANAKKENFMMRLVEESKEGERELGELIIKQMKAA